MDNTKPQTVEELLVDWYEADKASMIEQMGQRGWEANAYNMEKTQVVRRKFILLDTGTSGAFMLERATGLIYRIKAYGKVDYRKCIGKLGEVDGAHLVKWRWAPQSSFPGQ